MGLAALWAGVRLAVIDLETCQAADGDHIVGFSVQTCRDGRITAGFTGLVNPGVPIDARTASVHGLTDELVADEPTFAAYEPRLTSLLSATPGQTLVVVAHNIGFDISRLRREYARLGLDLPEAPVLDTGRLAHAVGVTAADGSLAAICAAVGVTNTHPHDAGSDATATAQAAITLIDRAAAEGEWDFDSLLRRAAGNRAATTTAIRAAASAGKSTTEPTGEQAPPLPPEHVATHARLLGPTPAPRTLAAWRRHVHDCAELSCELLADRAATARAPQLTVRTELEAVLAARLDAGDRPGAAAVLGAVAPLLTHLPDRHAALAWYDRWAARLAGHAGPCDSDDPCPSCRAAQPCPFDTWHQPLAAAALGRCGPKSQTPDSFLHTNGADTGKGVYLTWKAHGRDRLADYTAYLVWRHWRDHSQHTRAELVAHHAWAAGCREPRLASIHAATIAAPGGTSHFQRGIDICDQALGARRGSSDDAWPQLLARRAQLQGRLARRTDRLTATTDDNGQPVPVRRHQPTAPRRTRPSRFSIDNRASA